MTEIILKLKYFFFSCYKLLLRKGLYCPSCGCAYSSIISKKYFVTSLRRCDDCKLLFRCPTTTEEENAKFYQNDYQEGFTTEMPCMADLEILKSSSFSGTAKDFSTYIKVLSSLDVSSSSSLLDFGCSWGYGSWQFSQHGFKVKSFEISSPRASYALNKLGVDVVSEIDALEGTYDVFFSSHVLEHVPSVHSVVNLAFSCLRPKGLFVAFTPNGSMVYKKTNSRSWNRSWGLKHPNHLDEVFYQTIFASVPFYISSSPYDFQALTKWARHGGKQIGDLSGNELLVVARKK